MENASNHHEVFDTYGFEEDSPSGYAQMQLMSCWNATLALPIVLIRLKQSGEGEDHPVLSALTAATAARSILRPQSSSSGGDSKGKSKPADRSLRSRKLKHDVIEAVNEFIQDITTCHDQIFEQAVEYIHQNERALQMVPQKRSKVIQSKGLKMI